MSKYLTNLIHSLKNDISNLKMINSIIGNNDIESVLNELENQLKSLEAELKK